MSRIFSFPDILFLILGMAFSSQIFSQTSYPTPPDEPQRLFFVQRTGNTNTIVYDANTLDNGRHFNPKQPIRVYWLRYDEQGQVQPLNYIQRTLAYGVEVRKSKQPDEYEFNVVSYPKRKIRLLLDGKFQPRAQLQINGREAWLSRVFVKIEGKKIGIIPAVKYVELFGVDAESGKAIYEKFIP